MKKYLLPTVSLQSIQVLTDIDYANIYLYPIRQGNLKEAKIIVSNGKKINRGDALAIANNPNSVSQHSAVGGTVTSIKDYYYPGSTTQIQSVEVTMGGAFSTYSTASNVDQLQLNKTSFLNAIKDAGIYDLDVGAIYPYLNSRQDITCIGVNAIEFSPLLVLEEKILQMHLEEIVIALQLIQQYLSGSQVKFILSSNYLTSRQKFARLLKKSYESSAVSTQKIASYTSDIDSPPKLSDNYYITSAIIEHFFTKNSENNPNFQHYSVHENLIVLKPSTLLAIYEAVVKKKPFIEGYKQFTLDSKTILIKKVPFGILLAHLISAFNKEWQEFPNHCFTGCFVDRNIIMNLATPINKLHSHYWFLSDEQFTAIYKKLKLWITDSSGNIKT